MGKAEQDMMLLIEELRVERWVLFSRYGAAKKRMQGCKCCSLFGAPVVAYLSSTFTRARIKTFERPVFQWHYRVNQGQGAIWVVVLCLILWDLVSNKVEAGCSCK